RSVGIWINAPPVATPRPERRFRITSPQRAVMNARRGYQTPEEPPRDDRRVDADQEDRSGYGQRDRPRWHADVDRGTAGRGPFDPDHPRGARLRRDADRHRGRLPPERGR